MEKHTATKASFQGDITNFSESVRTIPSARLFGVGVSEFAEVLSGESQ